MANNIRITNIEQIENGNKRIVHMENSKTGDTYSAIYGDSVSERWIRFAAPMLLKTKRKSGGI